MSCPLRSHWVAQAYKGEARIQLGERDEPGDQPLRVGQKQIGALSAIFLIDLVETTSACRFFYWKLPPRPASQAKSLVEEEATLLQT